MEGCRCLRMWTGVEKVEGRTPAWDHGVIRCVSGQEERTRRSRDFVGRRTLE